MTKNLLIHEIYASIQGESQYAGLPCTFVRLTGCPLRCRWCDTAHAFHEGQKMPVASVVAEVLKLGIPLVEVTGGEPLAQEACLPLLQGLVDSGSKVLLETSGSECIKSVPSGVHIVMDLKAPGSKMDHQNRLENLNYLKPTDDLKFVLADRADFDWAVDLIARESLTKRCHVLLSCAFGLVSPKDLAAWMLENPYSRQCRLQLQQHKYIWGPRTKGV